MVRTSGWPMACWADRIFCDGSRTPVTHRASGPSRLRSGHGLGPAPVGGHGRRSDSGTRIHGGGSGRAPIHRPGIPDLDPRSRSCSGLWHHGRSRMAAFRLHGDRQRSRSLPGLRSQRTRACRSAAPDRLTPGLGPRARPRLVVFHSYVHPDDSAPMSPPPGAERATSDPLTQGGRFDS